MYIFFCLLLFLILAGISFKKSKFITAIFVLLFIVTAVFCRSHDDYFAYLAQYERALSGSLPYEPLYSAIMIFFAQRGINYDLLKFLISIIEIICILYVINEQTKYTAFTLMLCMLYPLLIFSFLTRYFMGATFVILALCLLHKRKAIKTYYLLIILAGLCHNTCFFFLCVPFLMTKKLKTTIFLVVSAMMVLLLLRCTGIMGFLLRFFVSTESKYETYIASASVNINVFKAIIYFGLIQFIRIILVISINKIALNQNILLINKNLEITNIEVEKNERNIGLCKLSKFVLKLDVIMFIVCVFQTYSTGFGRLFQILDIFNYLLIAKSMELCAESKNKRYWIIILSFFYIFLMWYFHYIRGSAGARNDLWNVFYGNDLWKNIFR